MRVAVVIPALNEAAALPHLLPRIAADRVVVVDNGSTDGTSEVAARLGAEVVGEPERGYGAAVLAGMRHLADDPPDVLVILDADLAHDPEDLALLVDPIARDRADLVLADRSATAEPGALTPPQRFGNALAVALIALRTGARTRDLGPFRAIRWRSLESLGMRDRTWGWNVEMQLKAVQHGLRIREIPLPCRARAHGRSKISGSLVGSVRAGARILWAVHHYGPRR